VRAIHAITDAGSAAQSVFHATIFGKSPGRIFSTKSRLSGQGKAGNFSLNASAVIACWISAMRSAA
jgi:hypothetical protein